MVNLNPIKTYTVARSGHLCASEMCGNKFEKKANVAALVAADELQGDSVMARVPHCFCVNTFGCLLYRQDVYKGNF